MAQDSSKQYKNVLIEDLKAYLNSLNEKNIGFCIILSNRLISNAYVINLKEFVFLGAVLKEITFDLNNLPSEDAFNEAVKLVGGLIESYLEQDENLDEKEILNDYNEYFNQYRELIKIPYSQYTDNKDFSMFYIKYCLEFLINEINNSKLPIELDVLALGVLNEINRVIKSHGCVKHHLLLKLIIRFYSRLQDYYKILISSENSSDSWNKSLLKYQDKLVENVKAFNINEDYLNQSFVLLFDLCKEWRLMFMRLLEVEKPRITEKSILIPDNIKRDLDEKVSQLIESKIEGKKK